MMAGWRTDSQYVPSSSYTTGFLNLPSELDIRSSIRTETFRPLNTSPPKEDIILMAEFSEIEGPMPLVTIPSIPSAHVDLNDFVVKVMSTDYLNTSGEFRVCADTQMVQQDIEPGIHVYVHYFTLYDVRARGFVRPMCLSYITADSRKLLKYFSQLRQQFTTATEYLKLSNLEWFTMEMQGLIRNLEYTKDRYIHQQRNVHLSSPKKSADVVTKGVTFEDIGLEDGLKFETSHYHTKINVRDIDSDSSQVRVSPGYSCLSSGDYDACDGDDTSNRRASNALKTVLSDVPVYNTIDEDDDEESLLKHTTLEAVALQLMECQHILDIIKPHLDKPEIEEDLNRLSTEICSKPQSPLYKAMHRLLMLENPEENTKPSICILSLMKRNFNVMRSVQMLCGIGYIGCLLKLRSIHEKYKKSVLTLIFEDLDNKIYDNPLGSLFIGNIPTINVIKCNSTPISPKPNPYASLCYDDHFVNLLTSGPSQLSTPDSEYADAIETPKEGLDISEAGDCLQVFPVKKDAEENDSDHSHEALTKLSATLDNHNSDLYTEKMRVSGEIEEAALDNHNSDLSSEKKRVSSDSETAVFMETTEENRGVNNGEKQLNIAQRGSNSSSSSWSSNPLYDWGHFEGIEEEEVVQAGIAFALGEEVQPRVNINDRMLTSQACRLSGLIQQFCGVSHCLVHALLSGRPIVLAAADSYKPLVMLYVRALSTLLPRSASQQLPVLRWHTGTITNHHVKQFQVMGVCIPERLHVQDLMSNATLNQVTVLNIETGHISGVAYSGTLVRGVEQYVRRLFSSNSALQTSLQAIIISLGLKIYLLYHLQLTTNRSTKEILKGIGVAKGDWDIVDNLCSIVQSQIKTNL
ncbi:guanine nucleotide exchange protein SMCR8-like isoform X2 [Palaemon carinicauda]|uniref:guanine nucleotide exchange protein SMCR8-like isoform X2 n=1 Tax=Palaemon carinicauda TaxID=392227 RepID=UPI0035B5C93B